MGLRLFDVLWAFDHGMTCRRLPGNRLVVGPPHLVTEELAESIAQHKGKLLELAARFEFAQARNEPCLHSLLDVSQPEDEPGWTYPPRLPRDWPLVASGDVLGALGIAS